MKYSKFAGKSKRKGITPVIAIVLLLMMTVAAAGMAYVWIMSLQESIAEDTEKDLATLQETKNARLSIASVWNSSSNIAVMIKNSGTYTFTPTDQANIQLQVGAQTLTGASCTALTGQGTTCTITSSTEKFPNKGGSVGSVTIKLVSPKGMGDTYICTVSADGSYHKNC